MPLSPTKIRALRIQLELTQAQAAERAGMKRQNWQRTENGLRLDPNLTTAERIAAALGVKLKDITA